MWKYKVRWRVSPLSEWSGTCVFTDIDSACNHAKSFIRDGFDILMEPFFFNEA